MAFAAVLATVSTASAQSSTAAALEVPKLMKQGEAVSIGYSNPDLAGQTVLVEVDNGMRRETQTAVIEIQLDSKGRGKATWTVPKQWFGANFNAPDAAERHATIL